MSNKKKNEVQFRGPKMILAILAAVAFATIPATMVAVGFLACVAVFFRYAFAR